MAELSQKHSEPISEIILYQTEDGQNWAEVRLEDETVYPEAMER